ncbi:hypothetical protein D3C72_953190 [compost metagenome]
MSTEVKTMNIEKLNRPLLKIGLNNSVPENLDFWKNNSFILPDEKIIFDLCY